MKIIERNYFTLKEMAVATVNETWDFPRINNKKLSDYFLVPAGIEDTYTTKLFQDYLAPLYWTNYVHYSDETDNPLAAVNDFRQDLFNWLISTKDKYETLIKTLDDNKTHLMDKLQSTSFSRFNDTPQASNTGFDSDTHATNTNKTITEQEVGTVLARITEINNLLTNYYREWANDFGKKFVIYE